MKGISLRMGGRLLHREVPVTLRVRYGETDQMGVAYYANYLTWFEVGRTELCRVLGRPYDVWEREGILLPVVEAHCRYKHSVRYDEEIVVCTSFGELTPASLSFRCRILRKSDGRLVAEGWTKHVFASVSGKIIRGGNPMADWIRKQIDSRDGGGENGEYTCDSVRK